MYTRIGPYQPLKKLATGGMADVFLAREPAGGSELCALKVLLEELEENTPIRENFADEASILQSLDHPSIIKFSALGTEFGRPYFVMEYVHGLSGAEIMLEAYKNKKLVPLGLSLGIIKCISEALEYGYSCQTHGRAAGIVHNDVSPHNFQIGFDGRIKLLDYGVAIREKKTIRKSRRGKFAYMSPEAIQGKPLDHRSDLFSLGVSLYEMVVHKRAFKASTPEATMKRILAGDIKRPSAFSERFPRPLEEIIMKSIALSPEDRFQSGKALADALETFAHDVRTDLSHTAQTARLTQIAGDLATERNAELRTLISEDPVISPAIVHAPRGDDKQTQTEPKVEVVMMELPQLPFKLLATGLILTVILAVLIGQI